MTAFLNYRLMLKAATALRFTGAEIVVRPLLLKLP